MSETQQHKPFYVDVADENAIRQARLDVLVRRETALRRFAMASSESASLVRIRDELRALLPAPPS